MTQVKIPTLGEGHKKVRLDDGTIVLLSKAGGNCLGVNLPSIDPSHTKYTEMPTIGMEREVIIKSVAVGIKREGHNLINIRTWRVIQ